MTTKRAVALRLAVALLAATGAWAAPDPDEPPNPLSCACSDVDLRDDFTKVNVQYSCVEQATFPGECGQPYMMSTPEEVPEGKMIRFRVQAPMFMWIADKTDYGSLFSQPGYMATVLAPDDNAVWDLLKNRGYNKEQAAADPGWLIQIMKMHVLPPTPDIKATWTTPFMRGGVQMGNAVTDGSLTCDMNPDGGVKVSGPSNSAWITEQDIPVCKGYVNIINSAIQPV